ncbi:MAG: hypothetical protein ACXW3U_16925 [Rhodoplanes sp.]
MLDALHAGENPIDPVVVDDPNAELHVREQKVGRASGPKMNDLALLPSRLDGALYGLSTDRVSIDDETAAAHHGIRPERDALSFFDE